MIRRRVGDEFWLITQDDHARLAGRLAERLAGDAAAVERAPLLALATAAHDAGWPEHDARPTLNEAGLPRDVFEMDGPAAHEAWLGAARQYGLDPYARLLVTLHQFHLSAQSVTPPAERPRTFEVDQLRRQFKINKFQHSMIELIEQLRGELGLANDRPLRLGLAEGWSTPAEEMLRFHFRLMQAMDGLSLALCCTRPPRSRIGPVYEMPGGPETALTVERIGASRLIVSPWLFDCDLVRVTVPYRAVAARAFGDAGELHALLDAAPVQQINFEIAPG